MTLDCKLPGDADRTARQRMRRPTRRCSEPWTHKVLGRGRSGAVLEQVMRARVLIGRRAVAELSS